MIASVAELGATHRLVSEQSSPNIEAARRLAKLITASAAGILGFMYAMEHVQHQALAAKLSAARAYRKAVMHDAAAPWGKADWSFAQALASSKAGEEAAVAAAKSFKQQQGSGGSGYGGGSGSKRDVDGSDAKLPPNKWRRSA